MAKKRTYSKYFIYLVLSDVGIPRSIKSQSLQQTPKHRSPETEQVMRHLQSNKLAQMPIKLYLTIHTPLHLTHASYKITLIVDDNAFIQKSAERIQQKCKMDLRLDIVLRGATDTAR